MARINFTFENLNFTPSTSPDVVNHRLRVFPSGSEPSANDVYDAPYAEVGTDGVVDQGELEGILTSADGNYDLYLTAVDDAGNESDYGVKQNVHFDTVAPNPPFWL